MSYLFDTHCHLADPKFSHSLADDLEIANNHSTSEFLSVGSSTADWFDTLQLAKQFQSIHAALGLHPYFIESDYPSQLKQLELLIASNSVSAIGEIGLDFSKGVTANDSTQMLVFSQQIQLAQTYNLPVSVHCLKAYNPMLNFLKNHPVEGVMHGFAGGAQMAIQFIDAGLHIGINSVLLNQNARRYHELVQCIGLDRLVLESDAPFGMNLDSDAPLASLMKVAIKIAELLECPVQEVIEKTTANAENLFIRKDS
ncbi:MAG: hypothetical protein DSZ27_05850 [Thiomicrospira sp.]|nr:MAG: hypothetical protein DSZ27_05850 [Thiomicrospira sp.]